MTKMSDNLSDKQKAYILICIFTRRQDLHKPGDVAYLHTRTMVDLLSSARTMFWRITSSRVL